MPQMAPINWLSLFFMFCLVFLMFNVMNYFSFNINKKNYLETSNSMNKLSNKNILNWKW